MSNKYTAVSIGSLLLIFLTLKSLWFIFPKIFHTLELQSQDALTRVVNALADQKNGVPDIVYIDLDDSSLPLLPYSKNDPQLYADLITILRKAGTAIQLIDIVFVSGNDVENLAASTKNAGNVYLPLVFAKKEHEEERDMGIILPDSTEWKHSFPDADPYFPHGNLVISNIAALNDAAAGLGHINCWPDHDGIYRRIPLFFRYDEQLIPALSLKAAADYLQVSPQQITFGKRAILMSEAHFPDGRTADISIPLDNKGNNRIHFIGPWPYNFAHYSMATILKESRSESGMFTLQDELEGTIAIISDVTTGGRDYGPLPFSSYSPLSGLHAQFLNSILANTFVREALPIWIVVEDLILVTILIMMAMNLRGFVLIGGAVTCICLIFLTNLYALAAFHVLLPLIRPMASVTFAAIAILLIQFISIQHEKRVMKARLAPYFAPSVMNKILASPEILTNVAKKELTIVFSDIVGFTEWSSTKDAQEIHETLNRYFQEMSSVVFSHEGTIDKFIGDGMLAFFGDPTPQKDHAKRAVRAAIEMQQKVWELKKEWQLTGGMKIRIRIGLHCGEVVVGNMGSIERMDYTVIGSHVNLAQRLESNCAPDRILISHEVYEQLDDCFITTSNGEIEAKGFPKPIQVYYVNRYQPSQLQTM